MIRSSSTSIPIIISKWQEERKILRYLHLPQYDKKLFMISTDDEVPATANTTVYVYN